MSENQSVALFLFVLGGSSFVLAALWILIRKCWCGQATDRLDEYIRKLSNIKTDNMYEYLHDKVLYTSEHGRTVIDINIRAVVSGNKTKDPGEFASEQFWYHLELLKDTHYTNNLRVFVIENTLTPVLELGKASLHIHVKLVQV